MRKKRRSVPLPGFVEEGLDAALERALAIQRPAVVAYLDRARGRHREPPPAEVLRRLERYYLGAVTTIGAAAGGAAAIPGIGTATSLAAAALEISAFTEVTALFTLAVAEVYGVQTDDPQLRRTLVLAVLLGDTGVELAESTVVRAGSRWGQVLAHRAPEDTIKHVNQVLGRRFLTHFGTRQGALLVGRALPLGVGAGIGAAGNAALGRAAVRAARKIFGPPPHRLPPRVVDGTVLPPPPRRALP